MNETLKQLAPLDGAGLNPANASRTTLILGVGNLLMGDEGVGVQVVRQLETERIPDGVRVLDGGTGGFHLLSLFDEHDPIILVDATMDGKNAGAITIMQPRFASDFPRTLSAHDIGLRDLLESAALLGPLPQLYLVTVSISEIKSMTTELSSAVRESIPKVIEVIRQILNSAKAPR